MDQVSLIQEAIFACQDAGTQNNLEKIKKYLDMYVKDMKTLHYAISQGETDCVKALLSVKADVNFADRDGRTPVHQAVASKQPQMLKLLLERKGSVTAQNIHDNTPLHFAARFGRCENAEILLQNFANVNALNHVQETPLYLAVENQREDVVPVLLRHKANVYSTGHTKDNFWTLAARNETILGTLENAVFAETMSTFCQGLHPRLGQHSSVRRAFITSELSERYLIWKIGLLLKPFV